jgi:translation initiation factor 2B subunit (eIF-2B alpha/beta/delta family)
MNQTTAEAIAAIASNNRLGAAELAAKGAEIISQHAQTHSARERETFKREFLSVGKQLIQAQPTMAPLVNLVNDVLWVLDSSEPFPITRQRIVEVASNFKHRLHIAEMAIAESVLPLIPEQAIIMTISRSSTVQAALLHARRTRRRFEVICAEARPECEGRMMAAELARHGIKVSLAVDTLVLSMVPRAKLILVGADHLDEQGLINKIGTYALTVVAKAHNIPVYALCGSNKFLPPGYTPPPQNQWDSSQVWDEAPPSVTVHNTYFDHTPTSHLWGIVTEQGVLPTVGIEAWLASIKLHPLLQQEWQHEPSLSSRDGLLHI